MNLPKNSSAGMGHLIHEPLSRRPCEYC
jgi:hypothetical protein